MSAARYLASLNSPLARAWYTLNGGARILMYHRVTDLAVTGSGNPDQLSVSPALFEQQIAWLSSVKDILPLDTLLDRVRNRQDTRQSVALSFDDGYLDNLEYALPVLEKYQAPATIYVTTDFVAQKSRHPRYQNENGRLHLDWPEVQTLADHPLLEIGSHTVSHPMLSELNDKKADTEIRQSKEVIENHINQAVTSFCYPAGNFTARECLLTIDCGYTNALTVKPGVTRSNSDVFALKRTEITWKDTPANMKLKLDGGYDLMHRLLDIRRELKFARARSRQPG